MASPRVCPRGARGPLLGSMEENLLNRRLEPIRTVDGYRVQIRTSGHFASRPLEMELEVSYYALGHSFPYIGHVQLGRGGFRIPRKGTLQVALFNPLGAIDKLFLLLYDLDDMPPNSQTFLRQRTVHPPKRQVRYMIQCNIVSSKSGRIYLKRDLRVVIAKGVSAEQLESHDEMPANPKYFSRL